MTDTTTTPSVLFVCVHNAGRSQMAAGFLRDIAGDRIEVRSAGSMPADQINPTAVEAMAELGIDITAEQPKVLTTEAVQALVNANPHGSRTLFAEAFQDNPGSAKVLTNAGFAYLGDAESWSVARNARVPTWTYLRQMA